MMQSALPVGVQQQPKRFNCTREDLCYPCATSTKTNCAALACVTVGTTLIGVSPEVGRELLHAGQALNALVIIPATARVLDGTPAHRVCFVSVATVDRWGSRCLPCLKNPSPGQQYAGNARLGGKVVLSTVSIIATIIASAHATSIAVLMGCCFLATELPLCKPDAKGEPAPKSKPEIISRPPELTYELTSLSNV